MMITLIGSFLASVGFGIAFNIDRSHLFFGGVCGMLGGAVYYLILHYPSSEFMALFFAAVCVSICSEVLARRYRTPVTTFVVCGIIPLVPGGTMYYTMLEVVNGNGSLALELGFQALAYAGAIAMAIIIVSSVTRLLLCRKG
ncbi:MAG: threonine/serine exporter family protein [Erysipelotrichaceae bacterium]